MAKASNTHSHEPGITSSVLLLNEQQHQNLHHTTSSPKRYISGLATEPPDDDEPTIIDSSMVASIVSNTLNNFGKNDIAITTQSTSTPPTENKTNCQTTTSEKFQTQARCNTINALQFDYEGKYDDLSSDEYTNGDISSESKEFESWEHETVNHLTTNTIELDCNQGYIIDNNFAYAVKDGNIAKTGIGEGSHYPPFIDKSTPLEIS